MTFRNTKLNLCWRNSTTMIWCNGTTAWNWLYIYRLVQPNGSDFGQKFSFNNTSKWLRTSKLLYWTIPLGLLVPRDLAGRLGWSFSQALTRFTCHLSLCGQVIATCPNAPQYKCRWFARRPCFRALDKGPRCCATSISIGVGPLTRIVRGVWLGI